MNIKAKEPNPQRIDMTGKRCGLLTVIEYAGYDRSYGQAKWRCKCHCGNETIVGGTDLRTGNTKSCGCLKYNHKARQLLNRQQETENKI